MIAQIQLQHLFPAFEPALLEEILRVGSVRSFTEGSVLIRNGQYIRSTMLILEGLVKIYRVDEAGQEYFIYHLDAGKACALSMICATRQETSELTAKAVTDTTILSIPLSFMDTWMMQYKSWYQFVLGSYRDRFEELLQVVDQVAFRKLDERLIFYLQRHHENLKTNLLPLTHTEIAQELNSSREVITRLLKKLSERGMVKLHRQAIEVVDLQL